MRIITRKVLIDFWEKHKDAEQALKAWYHEVKNLKWKTPAAIKKKYRTASILKSGRVVFNICGRKYRLVVQILYEPGIIYIRFIGTHKEYNKINAEVI